ncbi:MAG: transcriptional repressor NrdR [Planctomycetes bacterium]|nr:transcriptional repressor NrdR [Planctomycetota bacterium]
MRCPYCKEKDDKVIDSRAAENGTVIRRRRQCLGCSRRFTTYERVEAANKLQVIKKNGTREPYQRDKLLGGVTRACWKLSLHQDQIEGLVDDVEEEVFRKFDREVPSVSLGKAISNKLRKVDKIAYLRFASLYYEFQEVGDFIQEAQEVLEDEKSDVEGQQSLFTEEQ